MKPFHRLRDPLPFGKRRPLLPPGSLLVLSAVLIATLSGITFASFGPTRPAIQDTRLLSTLSLAAMPLRAEPDP